MVEIVLEAAMLLEVTHRTLEPERLREHVRNDASGAVALFLGVVRNNSRGRQVRYLEYDAYPQMAEKIMQQIAHEIMERWSLSDVAMQHRIGRLEIGEPSLVIAVASPHRREAFEGCQDAVERIKEALPIWKKEVCENGEVWIEGDPSAPSKTA